MIEWLGFFWESIDWSFVWKIIAGEILVISFIIAYLALKQTKPLPELDCISATALYFKLDTGGYLGSDGHSKENGYIFKIDVSLTNTSIVPASIRDIKINDFVLSGDLSKQTKVQIEIPSTLLVRCLGMSGEEEVKHLPKYFDLYGSGVVDIRPNITLNSSEEGLLRVVVAFKDAPKKIKVKIKTPPVKRPFKIVIEGEKLRGITEESEYGIVCDWFTGSGGLITFI